MKIYYHQFCTVFGRLRIAFNNSGVIKLDLPNQSEEEMVSWLKGHYYDISKYNGKENEYSSLIKSYLEGRTKELDVPIQLNGTDFQKQVWEALRNIPYGEVSTYKEIAKIVGKEKGCRAVGQANNKNPIPIIVPCHRVIGSNGSLVGFAGGLDFKVKLLELEGIKVLRQGDKY